MKATVFEGDGAVPVVDWLITQGLALERSWEPVELARSGRAVKANVPP